MSLKKADYHNFHAERSKSNRPHNHPKAQTIPRQNANESLRQRFLERVQSLNGR